jgi:hypothetical protein
MQVEVNVAGFSRLGDCGAAAGKFVSTAPSSTIGLDIEFEERHAIAQVVGVIRMGNLCRFPYRPDHGIFGTCLVA